MNRDEQNAQPAPTGDPVKELWDALQGMVNAADSLAEIANLSAFDDRIVEARALLSRYGKEQGNG